MGKCRLVQGSSPPPHVLPGGGSSLLASEQFVLGLGKFYVAGAFSTLVRRRITRMTGRQADRPIPARAVTANKEDSASWLEVSLMLDEGLA